MRGSGRVRPRNSRPPPHQPGGELFPASSESSRDPSVVRESPGERRAGGAALGTKTHGRVREHSSQGAGANRPPSAPLLSSFASTRAVAQPELPANFANVSPVAGARWGLGGGEEEEEEEEGSPASGALDAVRICRRCPTARGLRPSREPRRTACSLRRTAPTWRRFPPACEPQGRRLAPPRRCPRGRRAEQGHEGTGVPEPLLPGPAREEGEVAGGCCRRRTLASELDPPRWRSSRESWRGK